MTAASVSGVKGKGLGEGSRYMRPQGDSSEGQSATLAGKQTSLMIYLYFNLQFLPISHLFIHLFHVCLRKID